MTLNAVFRWKHPDSTQDMNRRLQTLAPRAIFDGGQITPGAGLSVVVSPFKAIGYDGMLVTDDAVQTLAVVANTVNYILVRAKYVSGGTPTLQWEVKSQAVYNADPDKNYLIVFGVVTLGAVVAVTTADISTLARDAIDPMQRSPFRGSLDNPTLLPAHPPITNHDGDFYFVLNSGGGLPGQTFYYWESGTSSWETLATGSYNTETSSMMDTLIDGERNRIEQGSGVISGIRPNNVFPSSNDGFASSTDIDIIATPSVANQIGINAFSAVVNGHYVQPYVRYITMPVKPAGPGDRYDLIFLEVYREAIVTPENHNFLRNPDGALAYTITQVSDKLETVAWQAGIGGDNFDLNELQSDDHNWLATKYRFGTISGVATTALYSNGASAALATNVDGNPFVATPGTGVDNRVWRAVSATSSDGFSYAIPLFVVRRTPSEDHTSNDAIQQYRSGVAYVFPVYPVADTSQAAKGAIENTYRNQADVYGTTTSFTFPPYEKPSGFVTGIDHEVTGGVAANTINFYTGHAHIRIRGLEDHVTFTSGPDFSLGAPPGAGTYDRTLVYVKLSQTLYSDASNRANTFVSSRHRPFFPRNPVPAGIAARGYKRGYVTFETVVDVFNATDILDEDDAMVAAGWTKGDLSLVAQGKQYEDGGIWSKSVAIDVDDRIHPYRYEWAVPVCLVHRRNTAAWAYATEPNGTTASRPDGKALATTIYADDLVDLRHLVDVDEARLQLILEEDIDKLMRGQLRTRLANKWAGAGTGGTVAGSRILQSDIVTTGSPGAFNIPHKVDCKIYSDAREFQPVAAAFEMDKDYGSPTSIVQYTVLTGDLVIRAPTGAHIVRSLPSAYFVNADPTAATFLDFLGQPCWTTQRAKGVAYPSPATLKMIDAVSGNNEEQILFDDDGGSLVITDHPAFAITARDTLDRATEMSLTVGDLAWYGSADIMCVSFWVHYDRSVAGTDYAGNYGMAEIPDEVHQAIKGPLGGSPEPLNIGTLYTTVRKTVVASAVVTISTANVLAASGATGASVVIAGLIDTKHGATLGAVTMSSVVTSQTVSPRDTLTITYSAPITMDVEYTIAYYTDLETEWIEVGRGGKSIRGLFAWHEEDIDLSAVIPSEWAVDLGSSTWQNAEIGGVYHPMPLVFTSATGAPAGAWTQLSVGTTGISTGLSSAGYVHSNMFSFDPSAVAGMLQYCKIILPAWTAPAAAATDDILVHYTYTPYQGLSGKGAIATPAVAVPKLKSMLHGKVVADSDHYVSQSGACSVFGGVDSWSGAPARAPSYLTGSLGADRFGAYNMTQLVKGTKANGLFDLQVNSGLADTLYAAAILRMPFPMNPLMLTGAIYHEGTFDFDIDPGREGASAGMYGYAPGYANGLIQLNSTNGIQHSQFVNGVSRLALPGEPKQTDQSFVLSASSYQLTNKANAAYAYSEVTSTWALTTNSGKAQFEGSIRPTRNNIVGLVALYLANPNTPGATSVRTDSNGIRFIQPANTPLSSSPPADYLYTGPAEYTAPLAFNNARDYYLCYNPGTVHAYLGAGYTDTDMLLRVYMTMVGVIGVDGYIGSAVVVQESARGSYRAPGALSLVAIDSSIYTDLVRIPMGSSSLLGGGAQGVNFPSYAIGNSSLRGRTVGYPTTWGATTQTAVENFLVASTSIHATYGRGLYLGTDSSRYSMPVMVPGSGSSLSSICATNTVLLEKTAQPPDAFPVGPGVAPFATSPKRWHLYDHGGPIGYCFYGLAINPTADAYRGRAVMQISGGPFMGAGGTAGAYYSSAVVDGTAIDAFWPSKRPLLKAGQ